MQTPQLHQLLPPRFPWREGNQFELLVDGGVFFPRMLDAIAQAQHSVMLEMYLVSSGRVFDQFKQVLLAAAGRGVRVRILLDGFGAKMLNAADKQALRAPNIEMATFNQLRWHKGVSNLLRNHRKLLLVDRELAFIGGTGLTDEFLYDLPQQPRWHEFMLAIRGPVVSDWLLLFERTWYGLSANWFKQRRPEREPPSISTQRGRVCASNGLRAHHVAQSLYQELTRQQAARMAGHTLLSAVIEAAPTADTGSREWAGRTHSGARPFHRSSRDSLCIKTPLRTPATQWRTHL